MKTKKQFLINKKTSPCYLQPNCLLSFLESRNVTVINMAYTTAPCFLSLFFFSFFKIGKNPWYHIWEFLPTRKIFELSCRDSQFPFLCYRYRCWISVNSNRFSLTVSCFQVLPNTTTNSSRTCCSRAWIAKP